MCDCLNLWWSPVEPKLCAENDITATNSYFELEGYIRVSLENGITATNGYFELEGYIRVSLWAFQASWS